MNTEIQLLKKTIQAEHAAITKKENSIESKFEAAERLLQANGSAQQLKTKVIRDTFSMPQPDHDKIRACLARCLSLKITSNKSEIIRAGLHALIELSDSDFRKILQKQEKVKVGAPSKQL